VRKAKVSEFSEHSYRTGKLPCQLKESPILCSEQDDTTSYPKIIFLQLALSCYPPVDVYVSAYWSCLFSLLYLNFGRIFYLYYAFYIPCHLSYFDWIILVTFGEEYKL